MTDTARLATVWLVLAAITVASWWLGPAHAHAELASVSATVAVLALGLVKARRIIQHFMEARTAPRWLGLATDAWLVALWGAILAIYLW